MRAKGILELLALRLALILVYLILCSFLRVRLIASVLRLFLLYVVRVTSRVGLVV